MLEPIYEQQEMLAAIPADTTETRVIELWLAQKQSLQTRRAYINDLARLKTFVNGKALRQINLLELQDFVDSLDSLADTSKHRVMSAIKSFYSFCATNGYMRFNVASSIALGHLEDTTTERLISEADAIRMIALEPNTRNHAILRLLYIAGLRAAEICGLSWRNCSAIGDAVELAIFGKGAKTRKVLIPADMWREMEALRGTAIDTDPVFTSRKGAGRLSTTQIYRIVNAAALRAKVKVTDSKSLVSPHWLRHAHVSHALDAGAATHVVQQTVGHSSQTTTSRYAHKKASESSAFYIKA